MSKELVMERIVLDRNVSRETTQVLLEGDIIVPDVKPDMALLLQTDAKVAIDKTEVATDRINFMGRLDLHILYIAKTPDKPVYGMNLSAPIDDFINMEGVTREMVTEARAEIANIDYKMLNDRKINYKAVVNITLTAEATDDHHVVVNIEDIPENQLLKNTLSLSRRMENKQDRFVVKDEFSVPMGKPNIREILQCSANISNKDVRVGNGRVTVSGDLILTTLYKGDSDDSLIEFLESEIPFNGSIEASNTRDDMFADVALTIGDQYIQVKSDADGEERIIDAEVSVMVSLKTYTHEQMEILEDAYSTTEALNISKTPLQYPRLVCRNKNQAPIKETVQIDRDCPDILQIFRVKGVPSLDEVKLIDDKIIVEGIITADILYVAEDDNTPLYSFRTVIPYRQVIETKGAAPGMEPFVDVSIDHVSFNMLSGRELEVRFLLSFATKVMEEKLVNIITGIDFNDLDPSLLDKMASITVYVVQNGDSLWKIAKRYNTAIDDILAINDIENPARIFPGQKLLILKRAA